MNVMNDDTRRLVARLRDTEPALADEVEALAAKLEEASAAVEEANRLRSAFLQNLTHEVRTPVTVMRGLLDILAEDVGHRFSDEQRDLIERVRHSSKQVLDLVEGVLQLSKAEVGMLEARRSRVYFPDLFADLVLGVESQLAAKGVRLVVDLPRGIDWILVDGGLLQSMVAHLLSNAAKFTERGEVRLHARLLGSSKSPTAVGVRAPEPSGDTLEIVVEDTGPGIRADLRAKIFEPFRQADGSRTRRHEGLGIGLSVAHRMAESLGGTLELESREGSGTRASARVPIVAVERPPADAVPAVSRVSPLLPLGSLGVLTDLANLSLVSPPSEAEAIAFALDLVDRLLLPDVSLFAALGRTGATIVDLVGRGEHGLGPGSPAPLPAATIARLATERRAIREARPGGGCWIASGTFVADDECTGALAARLSADDASGDESKLLQVAAGWLGREIARARADRERADLVATLGRDVKNPLGAALAHTQALLRGLHGALGGPQRRTVLELERDVHRVILTTLELLEYHRVRIRGFEVTRRPFSLVEVLDHVLSRQGASIELGGVILEKQIDADLPRCDGDLVRADRVLAIVLRSLVARLEPGARIDVRSWAEPTTVCLEIRGRLAEPAPLVAAYALADAPLSLGEGLGPRLARGWIEAQAGSITVEADESGVRFSLRFPRSTD